MNKPTHHDHPLNSRAAEALQRAEEDRLRRQAEERLSLENPPRRGIDLATHQVAQGIFEVPHPQLHLGDINAEVNRRAQEQAGGPQVAGFQAVNRPSNETGHALGPVPGPVATPAHHQDTINQPGRPDSPPTVRATPPIGYFPLPPERPESMRASPTPPRMRPMALPRAPAPPTPVSQAVHSSQESEDAPEEKAHKTFKQVTIHTAKCDVCNRHNKATLHRCVDCGWQICTPCWDARGGNGEHFPRRKFNGPTFGGSQLKKDKEKAKEVQKGPPKTPDTPRVRTPQRRNRSTPVRTPRVQTRNTPVQSAQRVEKSYLEPGRESRGHETDDTLSCTDDNDNRPPTRGKGKAMGRVDEDGDVAMSGMPPVETPQPDTEEKRRLDAVIGLLMLGGHVPRDPPPAQAPGPQYYPQTPVLNRPVEDTHPNPTYQDLSAQAAARFDALLAAAELVLGPGSNAASFPDGHTAQVVQGNQYAQASHSSQAGPAAQTYAAAPTPAQAPAAPQSPTHPVPMGPPPPPGHPYGQAHPEQGQTESIDIGSRPEMSRQQPPPQPAATNEARPNPGPQPATGARRGISARAAATRRTLPVPEHPDPLWTPEWFNTMAEHLKMLQRIGLAPQDREFTRLNPAPQAPAPEIPPNAVYERRYDQWLTPEAEARARAAAAILRGEVPISTVGVPGFGPAQGENQSPSAAPAAGPSQAGPATSAYHNADPSADISNVNMPPSPAGPSNAAASSLFSNTTTTATPLDQDHNVVIPARRPASNATSTSPHDPKRQAIETATGVEAVSVSVSGPRVPTPVSVDQARNVTQIPGLGGHIDENVMEVDGGEERSGSKSRGRAWEL